MLKTFVAFATSLILIHSYILLLSNNIVHSTRMLHNSTWFIPDYCYISNTDSLLTDATSFSLDTDRPMIHEVCLDFLASLTHSLCQSQLLMPVKTSDLIQL